MTNTLTEESQTLTFIAYRGHQIENRHQVHLAISGRNATKRTLDTYPLYFNPPRTKGLDNPNNQAFSTFFRSAAKPFQAVPLITNNAYKTLSSEELAVICASHTASTDHLNHITNILKKAGLSHKSLECGAHDPIDINAQALLSKNGLSPERIHNNCSGKHAGMLLACIDNNYPTEGYLSPTHPLQEEISDHLKHLSGLSQIETAVDGCGVPTYYLPLSTMATLYEQLITDPLHQPIVQAMTTHPELAGGKNRIDSLIMKASKGNLLAKVGADGLICIGNINKQAGLAFKVADGSTEIRNIAIIQLLEDLEWLESNQINMCNLKTVFSSKRFNTLGETVGHYQFLA